VRISYSVLYDFSRLGGVKVSMLASRPKVRLLKPAEEMDF
jgi:hypothetical protein